MSRSGRSWRVEDPRRAPAPPRLALPRVTFLTVPFPPRPLCPLLSVSLFANLNLLLPSFSLFWYLFYLLHFFLLSFPHLYFFFSLLPFFPSLYPRPPFLSSLIPTLLHFFLSVFFPSFLPFSPSPSPLFHYSFRCQRIFPFPSLTSLPFSPHPSSISPSPSSLLPGLLHTSPALPIHTTHLGLSPLNQQVWLEGRLLTTSLTSLSPLHMCIRDEHVKEKSNVAFPNVIIDKHVI